MSVNSLDNKLSNYIKYLLSLYLQIMCMNYTYNKIIC